MKNSAWFVTIAPLAPIAFIMWVYRNLPWNPLRVFGLLLTVISLSLLTIARLQLGNAFSITPQANELITHGIYSRVRHPVYLFGILTFAGVALYVNLPQLLLLLVIVVPLQIARSRAEERVLQAKFGERFIQYKQTTWF